MNQGLNLQELATRISADRLGLKDYVGDTRYMSLDAGQFVLPAPDARFNGTTLRFDPTELMHSQIAEKVGIPAKYYDRMRYQNPALLQTSVNSWFQKEPSKRMIRTTNGRARAFLSEGYSPLDNYDVAENLLPALAESGLRVVSSQITETRLYIQAISDRLIGDVKVGDPVQGGVTIRNSEVGRGLLAIEDLVWRLVCKNGLITQNVVRQAHVGGSKRSDVTFAEEVKFESSTRELADRAFWAQARDAMKFILTPENFAQKIDRMSRASKIEIAKPTAAVEMIADDFNLNDAEKDGVLASLIKGADLSVWGLVNAVTAQAHDEKDQDRAYEFEKLGGQIMELPAKKFLDLN